MDVAPWGSVDKLVVAVGGRDEQPIAAITDIGAAETADLMASEMQVRSESPADVSDAYVNLTMHLPASCSGIWSRSRTGECSWITSSIGARSASLSETRTASQQPVHCRRFKIHPFW
jgi:hypothetical protein